MESDDEEDAINPAPPTNIMDCLNKDSTINYMKLCMFRHNEYVRKVQENNTTSIIDKMIDEALAAFIEELQQEEAKSNKPKQNRSVFRRGINKFRNSDGEILTSDKTLSNITTWIQHHRRLIQT
jgi:hypothetical protein